MCIFLWLSAGDCPAQSVTKKKAQNYKKSPTRANPPPACLPYKIRRVRVALCLCMEEMKDTALLVIDMQRDFVEADGALPVAGAAATVGEIARCAAEMRRRGATVVHVVRAHHPSGSDAETFRRRLFESGGGYCVEGTRGAEIVDGLAPCPDDVVVRKTRFSGFFRTELDEVLRSRGIARVVVAGTQYPNCIRATAVDALARDYRVEVATDCCSAASEAVAVANVADMRLMGIRCEPWRRLSEFCAEPIA